MKTKEKQGIKDKNNNNKIKRQVSIITLFLWIFLVATLITIISGNIDKTSAYGSESVQVGNSGNNRWDETIIYHANYPNSTDDQYRVQYSIRSNTTVYTLSSSNNWIKSFSEVGFTVPRGYKLKPKWNSSGTTYWYSDSSGGTRKTSIQFNKNNPQTHHLYAQYEKVQFTLVYDSTGGGGAQPMQDSDENGNITITDIEPQRDGYKFWGWCEDRTGKGKRYFRGDTITLTEDTTLYAVWGPINIERRDLQSLGDIVKLQCISNYFHYDKDKYCNIMENSDEYAAKIGEVIYSEEKGLYLCDIELDGYEYCKIYDAEVSDEGQIHVLDRSETQYKNLRLYFDEDIHKWKILDDIELPIVFKIRCNSTEYIGKYKVIHEYYLKDKNNNLNLENTISEKEELIFLGSENGKIVGISNDEERVDVEIEKKPYCNIDNIEYIYEYYENSGNVTILPGNIKEITLKYVREEENEEKIKVKKIWEDENNKYGKRSESVVLQIKKGEVLIAEREVSEENNWSSDFIVPKYDKDGNEIKYIVDEKETNEFYEKILDGYTVINKYKNVNINDDDNIQNDIVNEVNVDTSDINIFIYLITFFIAVIGIIFVRENKLNRK